MSPNAGAANIPFAQATGQLEKDSVQKLLRNYTVICEACGAPTTVALSRPRGTNPLKRWELICLSLDKVVQRRRKNEEEFEAEWKGYTPLQKQEYYLKHKVNANKAGVKRDLQGEHKVQEVSAKAAGARRTRRDWGKPYHVYEREEVGRGIDLPTIKQSWADLIANDKTDKEKDNGEWIVFFYEGVMRDRYEDEGTSRNLVRNDRVTNSDELKEAVGAADKSVQRHKEAVESQVPSATPTLKGDAPVIADSDVAMPARSHFNLSTSATTSAMARGMDSAQVLLAKMDESFLMIAAAKQKGKTPSASASASSNNQIVSLPCAIIAAKQKFRSHLDKLDTDCAVLLVPVDNLLLIFHDWANTDEVMIPDGFTKTDLANVIRDLDEGKVAVNRKMAKSKEQITAGYLEKADEIITDVPTNKQVLAETAKIVADFPKSEVVKRLAQKTKAAELYKKKLAKAMDAANVTNPSIVRSEDKTAERPSPQNKRLLQTVGHDYYSITQ